MRAFRESEHNADILPKLQDQLETIRDAYAKHDFLVNRGMARCALRRTLISFSKRRFGPGKSSVRAVDRLWKLL